LVQESVVVGVMVVATGVVIVRMFFVSGGFGL
jgi:hypothetical protein